MSKIIHKASLEYGNIREHTLTFLLDEPAPLCHFRRGEYAIINLSKLSLTQAEKLNHFILNEL